MTLEFDCVECHRHIIRFFQREGEPLLCLECIFLPGWYTDPGLRQILDPTMEAPSSAEEE